MPIYDFRCTAGHTHERIRSYERRDEPAPCKTCGEPTKRLAPLTHAMPDGMYSYAPNVGDEASFARRLDTLKNDGPKVMPKLESGQGY